MADQYPFWPSGETRRPAAIVGGQLTAQLADLVNNQIPMYRNVDVPLFARPQIRTPKPEYPTATEGVFIGRVGSGLFDLMRYTIATPPEQQFAAQMQIPREEQ